MSKKGQHNISGVEAQQWAALSLFLQHLSNSEFDRIELEPSHFHDFNLVFKDDRKIICESKYYKTGFNYSDLKKILASTTGNKNIGVSDTILIVCKSYSKSLANDVKMVRYFPDKFNQIFRNKRFKEQEIELLPAVNFWTASVEANKQLCHMLLEDYSWFWIPKQDLERFCNTLRSKFNELAKVGGTFSRIELKNDLEAFQQEIIKKTNYYDSEKRNAEEMVSGIKGDLINNNSPRWAEYNIAALSSQPHLLAILYNELIKKLSNTDLSAWGTLWEPNRSFGFSHRVFDIFSKNLNTAENRQYVLQFISSHINRLRGFYRSENFTIEAIRIIDKIVEIDTSLLSQAFQTLKMLLSELTEEFLFVENDRDLDYKKDQIANLLNKIYKQSDSRLQDDIIKYIPTTFDLIRGHRETPGAIYSILQNYLVSDLSKFTYRFKELTKLLSNQYGKLYQGRLHNGWDHMGSTGSFMGRNYSVSDSEFVEIILEPSLNQFYENNPHKAWKFIKEYCVIPEKKVSITRPDFLNRSVVQVVLKQYKSKNNRVSKEAFKILKEFILSRRGIPSKSELIYQSIRGNDFTDNQKWRLVQVSLIDKYDYLPITPFVEQIVTDLAKKNHSDARKALKGWFDKPEYFKKFRIVDNAIPNIEAFLESDLTLAVSLFERFINNGVFINKDDDFDAYDAAVILQKIVNSDFAKGLDILKKLVLIERPTVNQQILISHGFFPHRDSDDKVDPIFLSKIYKEYVKPHLIKFNDPSCLTHSHSRASFLQFARKLAVKELVSEALELINVFIDDPDPFLPGKDPEDPENKYNEHKHIEDGKEPSTITSVRGWCAWVLASCPAIASREFIPQILALTEKLLRDQNWYVKHMACFGLTQLARNRLSVMPPEKRVLYLDLNNDKTDALKKSKKIEALAFALLEEVSNTSENIQKALARSVLSPFDHIRALSQKDAEKLLKMIEASAIPLKIKFAPLLIFFAEFRKISFIYQNWPWQVQGYYDDLQEFDDSSFKKTLEQWTVDGPAEIRTNLAWEFWALIQKAYEDKFEKHFPIALKYLGLATKKYEHGVFENIYRFIDDCIGTHFDESFALWKKCLKSEKAFFDKKFDPYKMYWWPHHYNGRILIQIRDRLGDEVFLQWLEFLSSYPEGARLEDLRSAVDLLMDLPPEYNEQVEKIFGLLINERKELVYCDLKDAWKQKLTGT